MKYHIHRVSTDYFSPPLQLAGLFLLSGEAITFKSLYLMLYFMSFGSLLEPLGEYIRGLCV